MTRFPLTFFMSSVSDNLTTTIMLWIGGQVSTLAIMLKVFLTSLFSLLVPLLIITIFYPKREVPRPDLSTKGESENNSPRERTAILFLGVGALLFMSVLFRMGFSGISFLLCRDGWKYPDYRIGCRGGYHGNGKNRFHLVPEKDQLAGHNRILIRCGRLLDSGTIVLMPEYLSDALKSRDLLRN